MSRTCRHSCFLVLTFFLALSTAEPPGPSPAPSPSPASAPSPSPTSPVSTDMIVTSFGVIPAPVSQPSPSYVQVQGHGSPVVGHQYPVGAAGQNVQYVRDPPQYPKMSKFQMWRHLYNQYLEQGLREFYGTKNGPHGPHGHGHGPQKPITQLIPMMSNLVSRFMSWPPKQHRPNHGKYPGSSSSFIPRPPRPGPGGLILGKPMIIHVDPQGKMTMVQESGAAIHEGVASQLQQKSDVLQNVQQQQQQKRNLDGGNQKSAASSTEVKEKKDGEKN